MTDDGMSEAVVAVLRRTRAALASPDSWFGGGQMSLSGRSCLLREVFLSVDYEVTDSGSRVKLGDAVLSYLRRRLRVFMNLYYQAEVDGMISWNDDPDRRHEDVLDLLDGCIADAVQNLSVPAALKSGGLA